MEAREETRVVGRIHNLRYPSVEAIAAAPYATEDGEGFRGAFGRGPSGEVAWGWGLLQRPNCPYRQDSHARDSPSIRRQPPQCLSVCLTHALMDVSI